MLRSRLLEGVIGHEGQKRHAVFHEGVPAYRKPGTCKILALL
jgi:hypothetical protein